MDAEQSIDRAVHLQTRREILTSRRIVFYEEPDEENTLNIELLRTMTGSSLEKKPPDFHQQLGSGFLSFHREPSDSNGGIIQTIDQLERYTGQYHSSVGESENKIEFIANRTNLALSLEWRSVFDRMKDELAEVGTILADQEKVYGQYLPLGEEIFKAFEVCPFPPRVVIIGQDPYHTISRNGTPTAMGMSFSARRGSPIPSSLHNVYQEIQRTVPGFQLPTHGDLTYWSEQGVLLLNMCLTVRLRTPGSHGDIWLGFVTKIINIICETNPRCIFVLWGKKAERIQRIIGEKAIVLSSSHPSGYSAHRGFFGCNHFVTINKHLHDAGHPMIDWQIR